jgi:ribonuclease BN (tRNA processing enzyme)
MRGGMKLRIIGPYGGEAPGAFLNCFLLDETVLIDAGSVCHVLDQTEQARIEHVLLSHAHLDHFSSLPHMAVSVFGMDTEPVRIHALRPCLDTLSAHVLNNEVWPDFTKINRPNGKRVFEYNELSEGRENKVGDLMVRPVRMNHPVPTAGFIIGKNGQSLAYSADTGSTEEFWDAVSDAANLRGLVVEVSFPNALQKLADITGHLTSQGLALELKKVRRPLSVPIIVFGVKPEYEKDIRKELKDLRLPGLEFPKTDKVYSL